MRVVFGHLHVVRAPRRRDQTFAREASLVDRPYQAGLAAERLVHGIHRQPDRACDRRHRGSGVAAGQEAGASDVEDCVAIAAGLCLTSAGVGQLLRERNCRPASATRMRFPAA